MAMSEDTKQGITWATALASAVVSVIWAVCLFNVTERKAEIHCVEQADTPQIASYCYGRIVKTVLE